MSPRYHPFGGIYSQNKQRNLLIPLQFIMDHPTYCLSYFWRGTEFGRMLK